MNERRLTIGENIYNFRWTWTVHFHTTTCRQATETSPMRCEEAGMGVVQQKKHRKWVLHAMRQHNFNLNYIRAVKLNNWVFIFCCLLSFEPNAVFEPVCAYAYAWNILKAFKQAMYRICTNWVEDGTCGGGDDDGEGGGSDAITGTQFRNGYFAISIAKFILAKR